MNDALEKRWSRNDTLHMNIKSISQAASAFSAALGTLTKIAEAYEDDKLDVVEIQAIERLPDAQLVSLAKGLRDGTLSLPIRTMFMASLKTRTTVSLVAGEGRIRAAMDDAQNALAEMEKAMRQLRDYLPIASMIQGNKNDTDLRAKTFEAHIRALHRTANAFKHSYYTATNIIDRESARLQRAGRDANDQAKQREQLSAFGSKLDEAIGLSQTANSVLSILCNREITEQACKLAT